MNIRAPQPPHEIDPTLDAANGGEPQRANTRGVALCAARLQPILRQVESGLDQPLRVADMAHAAGLSLFHFSREFRRVTGVSPYAYIRRRRIARSALLLAGSKLPIVEIARIVGFKTHAHFSGAFLKTVGLTPRTYRLRYGSTGRVLAPSVRRTEVRVAAEMA
ncbi:MAG TPA: AraC family transcriptional regulator [Usitatibacter sp.]|nr:AraC family transcriptional regulator [Usitatibacter sp.]